MCIRDRLFPTLGLPARAVDLGAGVFPCAEGRSCSMRISRLSRFRMAMTAPRTRNAFGSPEGLRPTQAIFVFSPNPRSRKRRRSFPVQASFRTRALCPGFSSLKAPYLEINQSTSVNFITLILCADYLIRPDMTARRTPGLKLCRKAPGGREMPVFGRADAGNAGAISVSYTHLSGEDICMAGRKALRLRPLPWRFL